MQGITALPTVTATPGVFPINGDDIGIIIAQSAEPGEKAGFDNSGSRQPAHIGGGR